MYQIPKELKSEVKITKTLYLRDVATFFIVMVVAWIFESQIHASLRILYYVSVFLISLLMILPSRHNVGKRNVHSVWFSLSRNTEVYHPIREKDVKDHAFME